MVRPKRSGMAKARSKRSVAVKDRSKRAEPKQDAAKKVRKPGLLLANAYKNHDPSGWWMSEKLDGVRAYWDGERFVSRLGNVFPAPNFFKRGMPKTVLDGELWLGRRKFEETMSVVKSRDGGARWKNLKYLVFDAPSVRGPFEARQRALRSIVGRARSSTLRLVPQSRVRDAAHLRSALKATVSKGGEGVMIREPKSAYVRKRSSTLLKVKNFKDAEARVVAHIPGKGKHKGKLGALKVRMPNGKEFKIGTGFSDAQRSRPPRVGARITYSYMDKTKTGIPKGAGFVAVRDYE
jgi:DNA ligase 1